MSVELSGCHSVGMLEFLFDAVHDTVDYVGRVAILETYRVNCVEFGLEVLRGAGVVGTSGEGSDDAVSGGG